MLLAALYGARGSLLPAMARWLDVGSELEQADYVLPLGGDEDNRVLMAGVLVKTGWARQALVTKTVVLPEAAEGIAPTGYEAYRTVLRHCGVADRDILLLGDEIDHTYGEIEALNRFLQASPQARVLVVTDGYHTRRTRLAISHILQDRASQVRVISAPTDFVDAATWWQHAEGFEEIAAENLKLLFYAARYGWLGYEAVGGAMLVLVAWAWHRHRRVKIDAICASRTRPE